MRALTSTDRRPLPPPRGPGRLLAGLDLVSGTVSLAEHVEQWGPPPAASAATLIPTLPASGLRGHGGAWFPVGDKWQSVAANRRRRPVVVANAAEGEPASDKDALLLSRVPHLVLDGASLAAQALRASRVVVYCPRRLVRGLERALAERRRAGLDPVDAEVVEAPDAFVAGQETAVVSALNRRPPVPTFAGLWPVRERGVGGQPTLVQNVETLAHVALVARFGPEWFRRMGTDRSPGTALFTVTGRWEGPSVVEATLGTDLATVLELDDRTAGGYRAVLLGGYGGGWIGMDRALGMPLTEEAARERGTSLGAGVVALLPGDACPMREVARVVRYMEGQGAGQCGPCVNGLADLAVATASLAGGRGGRGAGRQVEQVLQLCDLVEGRGACRHPDGVARFVRTAIEVFGDDVAAHLGGRSCGARDRPVLPVPEPDRQGREVALP